MRLSNGSGSAPLKIKTASLKQRPKYDEIIYHQLLAVIFIQIGIQFCLWNFFAIFSGKNNMIPNIIITGSRMD